MFTDGSAATAGDTGAMDSGATTGVIDRKTATRLGLKIEPEMERYTVRFGQGAPVTVRECVRGAGFVGKMAVLDGVATTLFPIRGWTQRQLAVTFTDGEMRVTTSQGRVLYRCRHDVATNLYVGDVRDLLAMPHEQLTAEEARGRGKARHALLGLEDDSDDQQSDGEQTTTTRLGGRRRTRSGDRYSAVDIEMARRAHASSVHTDLHRMEHIARHGCWANMPTDLQGIIAKIATKHACAWCRLARDKSIDRPLGSGVHEGEVGAAWSFDLLGPYAPLTLHRAIYILLFKDLCCGYKYALLLDAKDAEVITNCGRLLGTFCAMHGKKLRALRCDAGSTETSAAMREAMARVADGVMMLPAAPRNQRGNPVERDVGPFKEDIALALNTQDALGANGWGYAALHVIQCQNDRPNALTIAISPAATPTLLMEGRRPDYLRYAKGLTFGAIGTTPTAKKPGIGEFHNELCVYVGHDRTPGSNGVMIIPMPSPQRPAHCPNPTIVRSFSTLMRREIIGENSVRRYELHEDEDGNGTFRPIPGTAARPPHLGLAEPPDEATKAAADRRLEEAAAINPQQAVNGGIPTDTATAPPDAQRAEDHSEQTASTWATLNGGHPDDTSRSADSAASRIHQRAGRGTTTRWAEEWVQSAVTTADQEGATTPAQPFVAMQPGEGLPGDQTGAITPAQLFAAMLPEGGLTDDQWQRLDERTRPEPGAQAAPAPEMPEAGGQEASAFKVRKERTDDNPSPEQMLKSPVLRGTWIPEVRNHVGQLLDDAALECSPKSPSDPCVRLIRWMIDLRTKRNPDNTLDKLKARLNVRGDLVKRDDDRRGAPVETYAASLQMRSFLRMMALLAYLDTGQEDQRWKAEGMDIVSCFSSIDSTREQPLYALIPKDYMPWPQGHGPDPRDPAINSDGDAKQLVRLNAAMHGLQEASRECAEVIRGVLTAPEVGMVTATGDRATYYWHATPPRPGALVIIGTITDDIPMICGPDPEARQVFDRVKAALRKRWELTHQPDLRKVIGIKINRTEGEDGRITLTTPRHIHDLNHHCRPDSEPQETFGPLPSDYKLAETGTPLGESGQHHYRRGVGLASYTTHCRPDIVTAYSYLSSKNGRATDADISALVHFSDFMATSKEVGLTYHRRQPGEPEDPQVIIPVDAGYRAYPDGRSQLGVAAKLGRQDSPSGVYDFSSKKEQGAPSQGVPEAEIKAAILATKYALAERDMMGELGLLQLGPTAILEDNDTTRRTLMGLTGQTVAMRHQAQQIGFVDEYVRREAVTIERCDGEEQIADGLTKVKGPTDHWFKFAPKLLGQSPELARLQARVHEKYGRRSRQQQAEDDETAQREYEALTQGAGGALDTRPVYVVRMERLQEAREEDEMSDGAMQEDRARAARAQEAQRNSRVRYSAHSDRRNHDAHGTGDRKRTHEAAVSKKERLERDSAGGEGGERRGHNGARGGRDQRPRREERGFPSAI
jgi:hypothetical protein